MKRFTETSKWSDRWFRSLDPRLKALWLYLCDTCDAAGIIDIDWELASFCVGAPVSATDLDAFNPAGDKPRIQDLGGGKYWLTKFVAFQYKTLSKNSPPQRHVLELLEQYGLMQKANEARLKGKPTLSLP